MSWLSRIFGGGGGESAVPASKTEDYKGFAVTPAPKKDGGKFRIAAIIEKDGRRHELIRADVVDSHEAASELSMNKARQMIDEQGDRLFDGW